MDWLAKLYNRVIEFFTDDSQKPAVNSTAATKSPIFKGTGKTTYPNEITMDSQLTEEQAEIQQAREKYIKTTPVKEHTVVSGDNLQKIADAYGVEIRSILAANNIAEAKAGKLKLGQKLIIPSTRQIVEGSVKNLNDVAKAIGIDSKSDFIIRLKRLEDGEKFGDNKFHTTPYIDKAGVETIGIGHAIKSKDEPRNLTNTQVAELLAKDLLKMEENLCVILGGRKNYDKLPPYLKEALLDMTFNKGPAIIEETEGLSYCLKEAKWEAAINKFTHNKSTNTGAEMSGLSKRRLFDISRAIKGYKNGVPQSNKNTAQTVYNNGIKLLRQECQEKGLNFAAQLAGYNKDVKSYLGNNIKYITE